MMWIENNWNKLERIFTIMGLIISAIALIISIISFNQSNLKPEFELKCVSRDKFLEKGFDGSRHEYTYNINLNVIKKKLESNEKEYIVDPGSGRTNFEIQFQIKNTGKVAAEETKVIFEFYGMALSNEFIDYGGEYKQGFHSKNEEWIYHPIFPGTEYSLQKIVWNDLNNVFYPSLNKEFSIWMPNAIIFEQNPYIDVTIVSKTSNLKKYKINVHPVLN